MQDAKNKKKQKKKQMICNALAEVVKERRGDMSQFMFAGEYDIPVSIVSTIERGLKDPQLTTVFKLAQAFGMNLSDFTKLICDKLPKDFSLIDL